MYCRYFFSSADSTGHGTPVAGIFFSYVDRISTVLSWKLSCPAVYPGSVWTMVSLSFSRKQSVRETSATRSRPFGSAIEPD